MVTPGPTFNSGQSDRLLLALPLIRTTCPFPWLRTTRWGRRQGEVGQRGKLKLSNWLASWPNGLLCAQLMLIVFMHNSK